MENKNGKTKKIRRKSQEEFEITNSTWKLKKKKKNKKEDEEEYSGSFVRTAVMGQGKCYKEKEYFYFYCR